MVPQITGRSSYGSAPARWGSLRKIASASFNATRLSTSAGVSCDCKFQIGPGLIVAVILTTFILAPGAAAVILSALCCYALRSNTAVFQALFISVLLTCCNTAQGVTSPQVPVLKWVLIAVCTGRVLVGSGDLIVRDFRFTTMAAFSAVIACLAFFASSDVALSLFKLASFMMGAIACMAAVSAGTARRLLDFVYTLHVVVVALSVPLYFSEMGYRRTGESFQGIFTHPQSLGVFLAPMAAFLTVSAVFSNRWLSWPAAVGIGTWAMIITTGCRTAAAAFTIAILAVAVSWIYVGGTRSSDVSRLLRRSAVLVSVLVLCSLSLSTVRALVSTADNFTKKHASTSSEGFLASVTEGFDQSRGDLIRTSLEEFMQHPLLGRGFGIAHGDAEQLIERDPIFGLPTGAPVEQGFLPTAILGQFGIVGLLAFLPMVWAITRSIARTSLPISIMCMTTLSVNIGEAIFFSTGGLGLQMWLLVSLANAFVLQHRVRSAQGRQREPSCT